MKVVSSEHEDEAYNAGGYDGDDKSREDRNLNVTSILGVGMEER